MMSVGDGEDLLSTKEPILWASFLMAHSDMMFRLQPRQPIHSTYLNGFRLNTEKNN